MPHILVVEDSRLSRRMVVNALKEGGHEITEAKHGEEALQHFLQRRPDCIVSDILMPVMDGLELLQKIREIDSNIPVIMASADIQRSSREICDQHGISAFLHKPIQAQELLDSIDAALTQAAGVDHHEAE